MSNGRVLSVQSHVVCGYVGNKSATLPLQLLGFDVDAINSVQLSNHTGYSYYSGQVLDSQQLEELVDGLQRNAILPRYSHLLTGYIGSGSFLRRVAELVQQLRAANPDLLYVCDPVMGDNGRMYVPAELLQLYKQLIVPQADVLTPNQFEAELLASEEAATASGEEAAVAAAMKIVDVKSACRVMDRLHTLGVRTVVLSSTELGSQHELVCLASQCTSRGGASDADSGGDHQTRRYRVNIPRLDATFTGSGDLFAACLLARLTESRSDLPRAVELTLASVQAVLRRTVKDASEMRAGSGGNCGVGGGAGRPFEMELRLVQCIEQIRSPVVTITAEEIHM